MHGGQAAERMGGQKREDNKGMNRVDGKARSALGILPLDS